MRATSENRGVTLQERLREISRDLERIRTGESKPDIVEYVREGDRFSVIIRPRGNRDGSQR
jgi:hypothetical protein